MRTPKSPTSFSERQVPPGILEARAETSVPSEAFGGVSNRVQEEEQQTGNLLTKIQDQADQFQVQSAKNVFTVQRAKFMSQALTSDGMNAASFSPDLDKGAYQTWYGDTSKNVAAMAKNPRQAKEINQFLGNQNADMNVILQKHVASNLFKANLKGAVDGVQNTINLVPTSINDMDSLFKLRDNVKDQVERASGLAGSQDPTTQKNLDTQYSNFDQLAIKSFLANKDVKGATDYINHLKSTGAIDDKKIVPLEGVVHGYQTKQDAENWYSSKGMFFRDSNGMPDVSKIVSNIPSGLTQADRDIFQKTVELKASKDRSITNQSYSSYIAKVKTVLAGNNGVPPTDDQVQMVINSAPTGALKFAAEKLAQPSHPGLTINIGGKLTSKQFESSLPNLYDGIMEQRIDMPMWTKVFHGGGLSKEEYTVGVDLIRGIEKSGAKSLEGSFSRQVYREAMDAYDGNTDDARQFLTNYQKKFGGQESSYEQKRKWIDEQLKPMMQKDASTFWGNLKNEERTNVPGEAYQSLRGEIGRETFDAIQSSLQTPENPNPGIDDFHDFVTNKLGASIQDLAVGMPLNNAIRSIKEWNDTHPDHKYPMTAQMIRGAAQKFPDGFMY